MFKKKKDPIKIITEKFFFLERNDFSIEKYQKGPEIEFLYSNGAYNVLVGYNDWSK